MSTSRKRSQSKNRSRQKLKLNAKIREQLLHNCGSLNEDDAIDPRTWFKAPRIDKQNHKAWQVCRQVADTLQFVLSGADQNRFGNPLLENVQVIAVVPAPDSRHLLITVTQPAQRTAASTVDEILATLKSHTPRLRAEIARSITRRRIPNLSFEFAHATTTN